MGFGAMGVGAGAGAGAGAATAGFPWLQVGGILANTLGGLFGGKQETYGMTGLNRTRTHLLGQTMSHRGQLWNILKNMQGNPTGDINRIQSAIAPQLNQYAQGMARNVGTDSGAFWGGMGAQNNSMLSQALMNDKNNILQMMLGLGG